VTIAAFFDMDRTVLRSSSGRLILRYLWQTGRLSTGQWIGVGGRVWLYIIGTSDFPTLMNWLTIEAAQGSEAEAWRLSDDWFEAALRDDIAEAARKRVDWHLGQGHHVVIASAATPYAVAPVAQALGIGDAYLATRLEVIADRFTGRTLGPACYGDGKLVQARTYAAQHGLDLDQSYFYSDSHHDLPLLAAVGRPVAVNPSRALAQLARARGWPVEVFR
jgi:putative phosphoserine phosphatase/1-acylglycerol-3-phosphate O-acyltransferase